VRERKGTKERVVGKAAGDECVFIPGEGLGRQMKPAQAPLPDVVGGVSGHGVAKPHGVIHRHVILMDQR
jgi:hypothetical protein